MSDGANRLKVDDLPPDEREEQLRVANNAGQLALDLVRDEKDSVQAYYVASLAAATLGALHNIDIDHHIEKMKDVYANGKILSEQLKEYLDEVPQEH